MEKVLLNSRFFSKAEVIFFYLSSCQIWTLDRRVGCGNDKLCTYSSYTFSLFLTHLNSQSHRHRHTLTCTHTVNKRARERERESRRDSHQSKSKAISSSSFGAANNGSDDNDADDVDVDKNAAAAAATRAGSAITNWAVCFWMSRSEPNFQSNQRQDGKRESLKTCPKRFRCF